MAGQGSDADQDALSHATVTAIADHLEVDPVDLDPPLFAVIDPDALDALFRPSGGVDDLPEGHVAFEYAGVEVVVHSDGRVVLEDASPDPASGTG